MKKRCIALLGAILLLAVLFAGCDAEVEAPVTTEPSPEVAETPDIPEETETPEDIGEEPTTSSRTAVSGILEASEEAWDAIYVTVHNVSAGFYLGAEDAEEVYRMLATMDAEEVLFPTHHESQQSDPVFTLEIRNGDAVVATIQTTESGQHFFRFTGTYGDDGDPGYVIGRSEALATILSSYDF